MKTCTVYYDPKYGIRHTLVCEVDGSGAHTVERSIVMANAPDETPQYVRASEERYFGAANVRLYLISEVR
jgi:hypothetical protein